MLKGSSFLKILVVNSSFEHNKKFMTSMYPALAISLLNNSLNLLINC